MEDRPNYRDEIATEIISRIEAGTTPWQKPWRAGAIGAAPFNPVTAKPYHGINDLWLSLQGRDDPRWMTYRQASEQGAQIRKGEKSATIEYWQWSERQTLKDAEGKPLLDADGQPRHQTVKLERPRVFYAKVFNAEQIDGLAPLVPQTPSFDPVLRADALMAGSGIPVYHDQNDRAFYSPSKDEIHLPAKSAFTSQAAYYEVSLHELGHATGHQTRLNRSFGPRGSEGYAREELRAEIASYMLARDLGISFDPSSHASYVESWLKSLRQDKNEIFRAAKDAETIKVWVMEPERRPELEQAAQQQRVASQSIEGVGTVSIPPVPAKPKEPAMSESRVFIAVPFAEKDAAKSAGAKWDRTAKSWYVPEGVDSEAFSKWSGPEKMPLPSLSPAEEFAEALKANGLTVKGLPVMDGEWHRVAVDGDKKGQFSGSYRGFMDGRPSGQITNYRSGDAAVKWVATGMALTDEARAHIQAEAANVRTARETAQRELADKAAKVAYGVWMNLPGEASPENCRYLAEKGVKGHGVKVNAEGQMVVPCRDAKGRLWSIQTVSEDGKRFLKDSHKTATMHVLEPTGKGILDALKDPAHGTIIIAEGYATAASLHEATGRATIAAFDSGNLMAVAEAVRAKFPDRQIVIAADNDHANKLGNVGMTKAEEAAKAIGAVLAAPRFTAEEMALKLTDFNDLAKSRGNGAVKQAINTALAHSREPERSIA